MLKPNLSALEGTPDGLLRDVTVDISDSQFMAETQGEAHKAGALNLKQEAEKLLQDKSDSLFNNQGAAQNIAQQAQQQAMPGATNIGNGQHKVKLGAIINGETGVKVMDTMIPLLFVFLFRVGLGVKVNKKELQLTAPERSTATPAMQACLDTISINLSNPWVALAIILAFCYSSKAAEIGMDRYFDKLDKDEFVKESGGGTSGKGAGQAGKKRGPYKKDKEGVTS